MGTAFSYSGNELDALAEARNYYQWILSYFLPHVGETVVEVGAGIGTFSRFLLERTKLRRTTLIEPAENLFPHLEREFKGDPRVELRKGYLENYAQSLRADSVVSVNVLEHVEDDERLLRLMHEILIPGGAVLLFTPALPAIYGSLDKSFDHYRRYTKQELRSKMERAGFRLEQLRYLNLAGVAAWFLTGKVLRWKTIRPANAKLYDRWVIPWSSRLERHWEPPLGQNLLAVGRKAAAV